LIRKIILALIVIVGVAAVGSLFVNRLHYVRLNIKSCFDDAEGLRAGAPVRIAGVDVGTVRSVRANPQNKSCPAEVEMALVTTYDVKVPKDSIAEIAKEGLLGNVYLRIDTTQASGAPIENYGYLKSEHTKSVLSLRDQLRAPDAAVRLVQAMKEAEKEAPKDANPSTQPPGR
jgi:phospholipid/cholesterol/gamma-HCH transport system substrate-binding protein